MRAHAPLALLALLALPAPAGARPTSGVEHPVHVPGGVSDAAGAVLCVRTPAGGVVAVDGATGADLWESAAPSRPLLLSGGAAFLLEERGALRVAAYDARSGRPLRAWPVDAPEARGLAEGTAGGEATSFAVRARRAGGWLEVGYEVERTRLTGTGPRREAHHLGVVRVEVASDRVALRRGDRLPPAPFLAPAPPGAPLSRFHAREADDRLVLGGPPPHVEGVVVGGRGRAGFERLPDGAIRVHRFGPSGARRPALDLPSGSDAVWVTLDRDHVALRRANDQREVDLYALGTGARVASLQGVVDVAVVGGRLLLWTTYQDGALVLRAGDLPTRRATWRRTVRAAPPAGPLPPPIP